VALGLFVVNDIGVAGSVSKRKVWRRGPNRPWGVCSSHDITSRVARCWITVGYSAYSLEVEA
jgi:hypothetical protein